MNRLLLTVCCIALAAPLTTGRLANAGILSAKRGFADTGAGYGNLQATGAGWYYTWGTGVGNPGNFDADHYPMFWNAPSQATINNVKARNPAWVLGFNEPERSDQANLTVAQAISSWTTISNSFTGTSTKLISPAVSDTSGGQAWLASFMSQANSAGLKVDAVAFHWYGVSNPNDPAGAAASFLSRVDSYHNSYGKPVFITEFAIHDWGGAYSDAAITEANRQFLDIVVPALESRSYVAGYAWYHWFSDAHLFSGSPSTPTPMGYEYVGALRSGDVENAAGTNYGQHVAYLAGGELQQSGASAGTLHYVNALAGTSTISGSTNWALGASSDWLRVQAGATLRKAGSNEFSLSAAAVTNYGTLEVAAGTMRVGVAVQGAGNVNVTGGTLAVYGRGAFPSAARIDVRAGGTLDVATTGSPLTLANGQTLTLKPGGTLAGGAFAASGATFVGGGAVTGNLSAQGGATVQVGNDGTAVASRVLIDNFETYALGDVRTVASPPWTAHQNTSLADVESVGSKALSYGWASDFRGTSRTLAGDLALSNADTATYFFRFNSKTDAPNHNLGLGDAATTSGVDFNDYEAQVRLKAGTTAGSYALDARNGGAFTATLASGLTLNSWYNMWMVVNQATDTFDVYMNTGTGAATVANKLNATPLAFRTGTTSPLDQFLALAGASPVDNAVRIDDLYRFAGVDLSNPLAGFNAGLAWTPETLDIAGDLSLNAGSTLLLNVSSTASHDAVVVGGVVTLAGTLNVSLADGAAAPQAGDHFDLFDFSSATGAFSSYLLPSLAIGLAWDVTDLATTGEISVVVNADADGSGVVDGADFLMLQRTAPGLLSAWSAEFGRSLIVPAAGGGGPALATPEPGSWMIATLLFMGGVFWRTRL